MNRIKTALVAGAGGFIGNAMVKRLKSEGYWVRGVDLKYPDFNKSKADEFIIDDLRFNETVKDCFHLVDENECGKSFDEVYQFAADMGGATYIFTGEHDADIMHNSAMINLNVCYWAVKFEAKKVFYSSSACMYPQGFQKTVNPGYFMGTSEDHSGLRESMAYPADPDSEYGWEKLFSERLYLAYQRNYNLNVRIARFHNIYGEEGTYTEPKSKAPAAMCRKVVQSSGTIEIIGDGEQTRSFLYIDDCIDAVRLLMESDFKEPINIGSEEMVTINQLADLAIEFSGKTIEKKHIEGAQGVRGRNSDNTLIEQVLNWKPKYTLRQGLEKTYKWINQQINGLSS